MPAAIACEEQDGFIWVFIPDPGRPARVSLPRSKRRYLRRRSKSFPANTNSPTCTAEMPVSVDHGIIGLMDPAHGPFVHQAWWWRTRHSIHEKQKNFEPIPNGFRMSAHTPSSNSGAL